MKLLESCILRPTNCKLHFPKPKTKLTQMFQNPYNCALQLPCIVIVIFSSFPPFVDRVGWVRLLSPKLVKQSRIVQSAMYSFCDTVITTKVLTPAVHSQFVLTLVVTWGFSLGEY